MSARKKPQIRIYLGVDGWRWQYRSENGQIQASGEAYTRRGDCEEAVKRIRRGMPIAEIEIGDGPARAPRSPRLR